MSYRMPPGRERPYFPYKIAALARLLLEDGVPPEATLSGTGLDMAMLGSTAGPVSIEHYLLALRNALRLSPDGTLAFRAGSQLHLSDHGMVGLLLLSCESVRDYFRLATAYQRLATFALALESVESDHDVLWTFPDEASAEWPEDLRSFLVEQQTAQQVTHLQDVLGTACTPTLACFAHPAPPHQRLYSEFLGCPCIFDWHRSELRYPKDILTRRPYLANPLAATMLQSTCDGLLADMEAARGFAGKVYATLRNMRDPGAGMKAVASAMRMTDRTLRRRLADEGTSFAAISHEVKYRVAAQHLKCSQASVEQVAAMAGFSDPANFRRAFIRWTSMTPTQFRRLQHR